MVQSVAITADRESQSAAEIVWAHPSLTDKPRLRETDISYSGLTLTGTIRVLFRRGRFE